MTGQQDYTARQAGYPALIHPNRVMRPMPNAVTLSLWLNTTTSLSGAAVPGGAAMVSQASGYVGRDGRGGCPEFR